MRTHAIAIRLIINFPCSLYFLDYSTINIFDLASNLERKNNLENMW
jgi:hypothetical protein